MGFKLVVLAVVIFAASLAEARYFRINGRFTYSQAIRACRARRARLAVILNGRQNSYAQRVMGGRSHWIGLNDKAREGRFVWINGKPLRFRYFNRGEPNNFRGREDCVQTNYGRARRWNDRECGFRLSALCQTVRRTRCPKTRITRGRCLRNGLRVVKHVYWGRTRAGRCRRKIFYKKERCGRGKFCRCSAVGDPHYRTYDGNLIHFYGICKYTLSKSIGSGPCAFNIEVKNERRGRNRRVSYTRYVEVKMGGVSYRLGQRRRVYVNGVITSMPISKDKVRVFYSGRNVQFVHKTCGVRVAFDGRSNAYLQISDRFKGRMTGICGSCDGNRANDMSTKAGKRVRGRRGYNLIGDSYAVKDDSPGHRCKSNVVTKPQPKTWCKGNMKRLIGTARFCGGLRDTRGPFGNCFKVAKINPAELFSSCKIDVCANHGDAGQMQKSKCEAYKALEERCNEKGVTGINWRRRYGCPLHCGRNKEYSTKIDPCPKTCENHFLGTKRMCFKLPKRQGCQCKKGFLRDGALCVKPNKCKCLELCIDKSKSCRRWKRQGRCKRFPRAMRDMCPLTCGFCKKKPPQCEDHISTRRCAKFKRQGKCRYGFYRKICGLTCNPKGCPCKKGRTIRGRCLPNKTRRVTTIKYVRSTRTGRCVRIKRSRVKRCGKCKVIRRSRTSRCNLCTRKRVISTLVQRRIGKKCVRRTSRRTVRCRGCPPRPSTRVRCIRNKTKLVIRSFNVRVGCYRCKRRSIKRRTIIRCGKRRIIRGGCNRRTRYRTITYIYRYARGCRCFRRIRRRRKICMCRPGFNRRYCRRGFRVFVSVKFVLKPRRGCVRYRKVRRRRVRCKKVLSRPGACNRRTCFRINTYVRTYVNKACRCAVLIRRKAVRCCCRRGYTTKRCLRRIGVIQTNVYTYLLRYNRRLRRNVCIKRRRSSRRVMRCGRRLVRLGRTVCRQPRCIQHTYYRVTRRVGCKCHSRKIRRSRRCCCRPPKSYTRCVGNRRTVRTTRIWKLVRGGCRVTTKHQTVRVVSCRRPIIRKYRCNRRTRVQLVTKVIFFPRRCRCVRRLASRRYRICACGPKTVRYSRCNRRTCRRIKYILIRVGPIRGRCITERRARKQRCCCPRNKVTRRCNRRTGNFETVSLKYTFVKATRTCIRRRTIRRTRSRCPRPSVKNFGCRGYFRKIVYTVSRLDRRRCRCYTRRRVVRKRCRCPPNRRLPQICRRGRKVFRTLVYRLRGNSCIRRIRRVYRRVPCRKNRVVRKARCNRSCRHVVSVYFSVRRGCRCVRRVRRYVRLCCCKNSRYKRCVRGNRDVKVVITRRLNRRKTRCIPKTRKRVTMIRCHRPTTIRKGRCNRRSCRKVHYITKRAVRNCRCVIVRRFRRFSRCCCRPSRIVRKRCIRNARVTFVSKFTLIKGRCVRKDSRYAVSTPCPRGVKRRTVCNPRTGKFLIIVLTYRARNCRCVRYKRTYSRYCRCPRPRFFRGPCRRNSRAIYRDIFVLKNGGKRCGRVRKVVAREPCRCRGPYRKIKCVGVAKRYTYYSWRTLWIRVKGSRLRRRVCRKVKRTRLFRTRCRSPRLVITACRRYRKKYIKYYSIVKNCRCYRRSTVVRVRACNCSRRNRNTRRCVGGRVKRFTRYSYVSRGASCVLRKYVKNHPIRCTVRVFTRRIRGCNLRIGYSTYKVYLRTRYVVRSCRCLPVRRRFRVLCRCPRNRFSKRCIAGQRITIKVSFIKGRKRCLKRVRRTRVRVVCSGRVSTRKHRCNRRSCLRKVSVVHFYRRGCRCFKRTRTFRQRCCCRAGRRPRPGVRPGKFVYRGCVRGHKIYTSTRYVMYVTRRFKIKINGRYFVRIVRCKAVRKTLKKRVICRRNPRSKKRCNRRTGVLTIQRSYAYRRGCRCVRRTITKRYRCRCNPKKYRARGPCRRGRFFRVVIIKWKRLVGRRCVWTKRKTSVRCRCKPNSRSKRCDGRGNMVTKIVRRRLVGRRCARRIIIRTKPTKCGRRSTKERVIVGRCKGNRRVIRFVRNVVNKRRCRCVQKSRRIVVPCRCKKDTVVARRCHLNIRVIIAIRRAVRVNYRCIYKRIVLAKPVRCRRGVKNIALPCNPRTKQRYVLVKTFTVRNCRCKVNTRKILIPCQCKRVSKYEKVCRRNNLFVITYLQGIRRGVFCKKVKRRRYQRVRCNSRLRRRSGRCVRCRRAIIYYRFLPRTCKCKRVVVKRRSEICCCKLNKVVKKVCTGKAFVTTVAYTIFRNRRCLRKKRSTRRPVICSRRRYNRKRCTGCNGIIRSYKFTARRCKCVPVVYRARRVKCCCRKMFRTKGCNARRGLIVKTTTRFVLRRGRCYPVRRRTYRRVICVGVRKVVSRCRRNRRLVKLIARRRRACRCFNRVIRRFVEPCRCPKKAIVRKTRCVRYYRFVSIYRRVYRRRRGRGYCATVMMSRYRERCRCPKPMRRKRCERNFIHKTTTIRYVLTSRRPKRCIKKKTVKRRPMGRCNLKPKLVNKKVGRCNRITLMRRIRLVFLVARNCRCIKIRRSIVKRCKCPRGSRRTLCRGNKKVTISVRYLTIRRGLNVRCIKKVSRVSKKVRCRVGVTRHFGRCFGGRRGLSRRFIFYKRRFISRCRCYVRIIRRILAPCVCPKQRTVVRCIRALKIVRFIVYRLNKARTACKRRVITEKRKIRCKTGIFRSKSPCTRNGYTLTFTRRFIRGCRCIVQRRRRRCHCRCRKSSTVKKCSRRYFFYIIKKRYVKRGCRCRLIRRVTTKRPRCPSQRIGIFKTKCPRNPRRTAYVTIRIVRRTTNSRRCTCGVRVRKYRRVCRCPKKSDKVRRTCKRNRWVIVTRTRLVISRRYNRCVRRTVGRTTRYVRCRRAKNVYKCNKRTGVLYLVRYRSYARKCVCRNTKRVTKAGRCRCNRKWKRIFKRCYKKSCTLVVRYRRYILVGRRCRRSFRTKRLRCCCRKSISRKWCDARRGLWVAQTTMFRLSKDRRRCLSRTVTERRRVRCKRRVVRRRSCRGRRLVISIYKNLRRGCKCRMVRTRVIRGMCSCRGPSKRTYCLRAQRKVVTRIVSYRLVGIRCYRKVSRKVRRVRCSRGTKVTKGKCNRATGKIYFYYTRYYVTRRCRCRKVVRKSRKDCLCRPRVRRSGRCNPRTGVITTTIRMKVLNRRLYRCRVIVEKRKRRVTCRPSRFVLNKKSFRCLPIGRFGIRRKVYFRNQRIGCRCRRVTRRVTCHCRCRGPRRKVRCSRGRLRIIYTYSYRFNGCKCRVTRRTRVIRPRCPRNRFSVSKCRRCRQTVTRVVYRVRACRCIKKVTRRRRVCCCRRGRTIRRCIGGRIKLRRRITYRFVPYRCLKIVRNYRKYVRCRPTTYKNPSGCRGRKYSVTRVSYSLRRCVCIKSSRRIIRKCPCRRARVIKSGCNRRSCRRVFRHISYRLVKFRCIRKVRITRVRCCCHRRPRTVVRCIRNRKIRSYYYTVMVRRTCVRKKRSVDITPRCGRRKTTSRTCRGRRLTIIIVNRWRRACRCYRRRKVIRGFCRCPRKRVIRRCHRGRFRQVTTISYLKVGIKCIRRIRTKRTVVVCGPRRVRKSRCNRYSCRKRITNLFPYVRGCRCYTRRVVTRVACCCVPRRSTKPRRWSTCNVRTGVKSFHYLRHYFDTRRRRCVRIYRRTIKRTVCKRGVRVRKGRCNRRQLGRRYQILKLISYRRVACRCIRIIRRRTQVCRCRATKYSKRCIRGATVKTKITERLVTGRRRRYCKVIKRVVSRKMKRCRGVYYRPGRCIRRIRRYQKIIMRRVRCKCRKVVINRVMRCGCPRNRVYKRCLRRKSLLKTIRVRYFQICPRSLWGFLRCRCRKSVKNSYRRIRCSRPRVYASKCKRGRRVVRSVFFRLRNCRCVRRVIVKKFGCKKCYNILPRRRCQQLRRRKKCVTSRLVRKHLCQKYCKSCRPCIDGPKRVRYYKKKGKGLKTDKRYNKKYLIKKVKVPNTRAGIRKCKKLCANNRLCKSFEVIKPRKRGPGGKRPTPGGKKPTPGGKKPTPGGKKPTPGGKKPTPGGKKPTPGGKKPTPGGKRPGGKRPRKTCTCVLSTVTPKTIRKYEGKNFKGTRAPRRTIYVRHCVKACKKKKVYRKVSRCRCSRITKVCSALLRVTWEKGNSRGKCIKRRALLRISCRRPCVNLLNKKYCRRSRQRGLCRRSRRIRQQCSKSCMPRCRCKKNYRFFGPCRRLGRRYVSTLTVVSYKRVLRVCTVKVRRYTKPCKRCNDRTRIRTKIGRCQRGRRTITTFTYYRAIRKGRQVCALRIRRVRRNCKNCCPSVITKLTNCRRGRRVRTRIYWARIRNCCRRRVVRETFRCNKCPRDTRRTSACRYGVRVVFRFWYARSATTGRCYRRKSFKVRSCGRPRR